MTGEVGVCIATSGPGATNLVTGLADALLDSVPMVAITGQVGCPEVQKISCVMISCGGQGQCALSLLDSIPHACRHNQMAC